MRFNAGEFMLATYDLLLLIPSRWRVWLLSGDMPVNIAHFMGSWNEYEVTRLGPRRARFVITNQTDRSSGSHFPGRFRPQYTLYLETLAAENPSLCSQAALPVILSEPVISVLSPKTRDDTKDPEGGGIMLQTFSWTEHLLGCGDEWKLPPPVVWHFIEIEPNPRGQSQRGR